MTRPLVSVIIPCFNHEKYLQQSILSVIQQSYKQIELIVIDDGSKDGSAAIIQELAREHNFIFIRQENRGVCRTLNRGIQEIAKGVYLALLASDDYWQPEKIEKQVALLEKKTDSEFCFTQAFEFEDDHPDVPIRIFPRKPLFGSVLHQVFLRQHVPAGSILFSRKLYDEVGGFDENLLEEDWDFVIRCAAKTHFSAVVEPLFYYRSHATNIMKLRSRNDIFHQKALLLSKNYDLVKPSRWLFSLSVHFFYDHYLVYILKFFRRLFK